MHLQLLYNKEEGKTSMWYKKTFEELTTLEFYKCLKLRLETFVVEQNSVYNDLFEKLGRKLIYIQKIHE